MLITSETPLILGLHRIGYPPRNAQIRGLFTSPMLLRFELTILKSLGYRFSTLSDAFRFPQPRTAVITFDDGYRDNMIAAETILSDFGAPATVFVVTADVGQSGVVWSEAGEKLPAEMLGWEDLGKLTMMGWEIGSHSHFHIHHDRRSETEQREIIAKSIDSIEKNLGFRPRTFAYPYGAYNSITKNVVRELNFSHAVTTRPPMASEREAALIDPYELPRISIGGRHVLHYLRAVNRTCLALQGNRPSNVTGFRLGSRAFLSAFSRNLFATRNKIMP